MVENQERQSLFPISRAQRRRQHARRQMSRRVRFVHIAGLIVGISVTSMLAANLTHHTEALFTDTVSLSQPVNTISYFPDALHAQCELALKYANEAIQLGAELPNNPGSAAYLLQQIQNDCAQAHQQYEVYLQWCAKDEQELYPDSSSLIPSKQDEGYDSRFMLLTTSSSPQVPTFATTDLGIVEHSLSQANAAIDVMQNRLNTLLTLQAHANASTVQSAASVEETNASVSTSQSVYGTASH